MSTYEIILELNGVTLSKFLTCDSVIDAFDHIKNLYPNIDGWAKTIQSVKITLIPEEEV